jgi:hypothetical protein
MSARLGKSARAVRLAEPSISCLTRSADAEASAIHTLAHHSCRRPTPGLLQWTNASPKSSIPPKIAVANVSFRPGAELPFWCAKRPTLASCLIRPRSLVQRAVAKKGRTLLTAAHGTSLPRPHTAVPKRVSRSMAVIDWPGTLVRERPPRRHQLSTPDGSAVRKLSTRPKMPQQSV